MPVCLNEPPGTYGSLALTRSVVRMCRDEPSASLNQRFRVWPRCAANPDYNPVDIIDTNTMERVDIMTSEKKAEANRRNALKSTGPRTPEGKAAVRLNALKHGLLSQAVLLPGEDEEALERVMNSIRNGLGMRETEIAREPSRPWNPHFYAIFAQVHNTL